MNHGDADGELLAQLTAWRADGAWRVDPVRFRCLEALARRLGGQQAPVRDVAEEKLRAGIAQFAARLQGMPACDPQAAAARDTLGHRHGDPQGDPLRALNAHIRGVTASRTRAQAPEPAERQDELASVRAFRRAWTRGRTQEQVAQALARKPANAGPLNSHALVLQSLETMRQLSPAYLRRFLVQVETLQWLEQAGEGLQAPPGRTVKAVKERKPAARRGGTRRG